MALSPGRTPAACPSPAAAAEAAPTAASFEALVEANLLRYATTEPTRMVTTLMRVDTARSRARETTARRMDARQATSLCGAVLGMLAALPFGVLAFQPGLVAAGAITAGSGLIAIITGVRGAAVDREAAAEDRRRVPVAVGDAYARLRSAVEEAEQAAEIGTGSAEQVATVRLMAETGRDLTLLVAEHCTRGTGHGPEAREAAGELFRMAAEADAHLLLARQVTGRIGGGESHPAVETARQISLTGLHDRGPYRS